MQKRTRKSLGIEIKVVSRSLLEETSTPGFYKVLVAPNNVVAFLGLDFFESILVRLSERLAPNCMLAMDFFAQGDGKVSLEPHQFSPHLRQRKTLAATRWRPRYLTFGSVEAILNRQGFVVKERCLGFESTPVDGDVRGLQTVIAQLR